MNSNYHCFGGWKCSGNILATQICKTTDTLYKTSQILQNNQRKIVQIIRERDPKEREGGRTVGSGRVATIIE